MIVFPNAKINIGLNVVSKRPDGYHNLETIYYPVQLADALEIVKSERMQLTVTGMSIDGDKADNLVLKAYRLLKNDYGLPPVHFYLHKVIPTEAGLGGGSSDAAFALQVLNDYFQLNISSGKLMQYAARLGADCPFFIHNRPAFASETGEKLQPFALDLSDYKIMIAKPPVSVSTPLAFANIIPQVPKFKLSEIESVPIENWKDFVVNDFEKKLFRIYPEIKELKEAMYQMGAIYASMSGSGSAVFGIFRHLPTVTDNYLPRGIYIYR